MKQTFVNEDKAKLTLYTLANLVLTILILLATIYLFGNQKFLGAFFGITALWFSVKAMCRYGSRLFSNSPIIEFSNDSVTLYQLSNDQKVMHYKDINEVKVLRTKFTLKLFFSGNKVVHPSGWNYVGIVYLFKSNELDKIQQDVMDCMKAHHLNVNVVKKQ